MHSITRGGPGPARTPQESRHEVVVELISVVHVPRTRGIGYRIATGPLITGSDPDSIAWMLAPQADRSSDHLIHSTSWRWEPEGRVVLTYATVRASDTAAGLTPLREPAVITSGDVARPRPSMLHAHHVVAHAVMHLAELARRDPVIARHAARPEHRAAWRALTEIAAETPTGTHEEAHARARGRPEVDHSRVPDQVPAGDRDVQEHVTT